MFDHQLVQVAQRTIIVGAGNLELRQSNQRIFDTRRLRMIDYDSSIICFSFSSRSSEHCAPVDRLGIVIRARRRDPDH
jgi:hypothetical protein